MQINRYKKAQWIRNTNVYEVNLRQYTQEGNFKAFIKELPRLKNMGVETLWFMPITPISEMNRKGNLGSYYACSDYTAVNPEFGTLQEFKDLVDAAHKMGFKILLDWVANHTGWDHVWTVEHPDYYLTDPQTGTFKMASGMEDIIELNYDNREMRKAMIEAMEYWVTTCDIDGFRSDLAFWVTLDFWHEARTALQEKKILFWLAEADVLDHPEYLQVFDAAYAWSWMHKTKEFYNQQTGISELKEILKKHDAVCGNESISLWFTSNHDENSWNGTEYEKYGNMVSLLNVFSFTWNGMPLIYSGQELPNLKRLEFFEKDVIGWNGFYELHNFYKTLNELNKYNKALLAADESVSTYLAEIEGSDNVIAYQRKNDSDEILVMLNFCNEKVDFEFEMGTLTGTYKNIFTLDEYEFSSRVKTTLPAYGYLVFEKR